MALLVLAKRDGRGGSDGGLPWMLGACVHLQDEGNQSRKHAAHHLATTYVLRKQQACMYYGSSKHTCSMSVGSKRPADKMTTTSSNTRGPGGEQWLGRSYHAGKWQRAAATKRLHAAARRFHAAAARSCGHHRSNLLALKN